jgi:predicted DNA-binding transcriptional regulator YafY
VNQNTLCNAIQSRNLVQFYYSGDEAPGPRLVEPHMVAYNSGGHLALSAWFLGGASESREGQGWREYLLSEIANLNVLPQQFSGPRPGYRRDGGKIFQNVQCAL